MAVLFSGPQINGAGFQSGSPIAISGDLKQPGVELVIRLTMGASVFPLGTTTLYISISTDGGATYSTASMTCVGPAVIPNWVMIYGLGPDAVPTHTGISINAPLGFTGNMTVEAI